VREEAEETQGLERVLALLRRRHGHRLPKGQLLSERGRALLRQLARLPGQRDAGLSRLTAAGTISPPADQGHD
jgi:hypothetical protein